MHLKIIESEELRKLLQEELKAIHGNLINNKKDWLTKEELMNMTGWSARTIQHLRDTRQIPFSQHGRKILYPYSGIVKFLEKNTVSPKSKGVLK